MAAIIEISEDGSLTLPTEALRELDLHEHSKVEWCVENGRLVLTPVESAGSDEEDNSWAATPEFHAAVERARADAEAGRVYRLGPEDLERIASEAEAAHNSGQEYTLPSHEQLKEMEARHLQDRR